VPGDAGDLLVAGELDRGPHQTHALTLDCLSRRPVGDQLVLDIGCHPAPPSPS